MLDSAIENSGVWFAGPDLSWTSRLAKPEFEICIEHNVAVPMRDGAKLSANIWRPNAPGKFPVIFIYTPYDNGQKTWVVERVNYFVPRGYIVAAIDARGRYDSEGIFYFYWSIDWRQGRFGGEDVYDCQTWLGEQRWSSGKIGMTGGSYLGFVQWMSAPLRNPHLSALIPWISPDDHYDNVYPNGAMQLSNSLNLLAILGTATRDNKEGMREDFWNWEKLYRHLPIRAIDTAMYGHSDQMWQDLVDHPDNDHYWRFSVGERPLVGEMGAGRYGAVQVPTLNITGWYDQVSQATINNYLGMIKFGPELLRNKHHLIVGPWRHGSTLPQVVGDLDYGASAAVNYLQVEQRWFDHWLKGIDNGIDLEPAVSIFVMGENRWRAEREWPLSRARDVTYYLNGTGHANTRHGDGLLSVGRPATEQTDTFTYDPAHPVPTCGGNVNMYPPEIGGPKDQRATQDREDVLVYIGDPLSKSMEVTGRVFVKLYASTSARDTDFTAKLIDVHPDGYAQLLAEGIIRGRYRSSFRRQELLTPEAVNEFTIDLWSISHVFLAEHRIEIEISSSNFPKYDRNPNTGNRFGEDAQLITAKQTIYHGREYPSRLVLPVVSP